MQNTIIISITCIGFTLDPRQHKVPYPITTGNQMALTFDSISNCLVLEQNHQTKRLDNNLALVSLVGKDPLMCIFLQGSVNVCLASDPASTEVTDKDPLGATAASICKDEPYE